MSSTIAASWELILLMRSALCVTHQCGDHAVPAGFPHPSSMQGFPVWYSGPLPGLAGSSNGIISRLLGSRAIGLPFFFATLRLVSLPLLR